MMRFAVIFLLFLLHLLNGCLCRSNCINRSEFEELRSEFQGAISTLQEENHMLRTIVNSLDRKVKRLETKNYTKATVINSKRLLLTEGQAGQGVAFSISVSPIDISNLGQHQTVKFDRVIANLGNAFDVKTGVFKAPVSGWYVFSLTSMNNPGETQRLDVVTDGTHVFHCFSNGNEFDSTSRTMVIHLNLGSDVWVQTAYSGKARVHGDEHTSFTGFLLYEDIQ